MVNYNAGLVRYVVIRKPTVTMMIILSLFLSDGSAVNTISNGIENTRKW